MIENENQGTLPACEDYVKPKENKYQREIIGKDKDGKKQAVFVDVYDVLKGFDVQNPALQHLIKKALCTGQRGHKNKATDLQDIIDSAIRAKELDL